jgi:purine-binding chemotaxis protein CheW
MSQAVAVANSRELDAIRSEHLEDFVTFSIADQLFGIPVLKVQDILQPDHIASIPLAPPEVKGSINLRGRIVTVIDVRVCLGLPQLPEHDNCMGVTVDFQHELYNLMVDKIGDVISLDQSDYENNPSTLDPTWREYASGVYRLDGRLMVVLDVERLLSFKE